MKFLFLKDGSHLALGEIVRHWWRVDGVHVETRAGKVYETTHDAWERAMGAALVGVLPAESGTVYLTPVTEDDGSTRWSLDPVLGWGVRGDGYVTPIGHDGLDQLERAVRLPSGKVTRGSDGNWPSEEAYRRSKASHAK